VPLFDNIESNSLFSISSHDGALLTELLPIKESVSRFSELFPVEHMLVPYDAALGTMHLSPSRSPTFHSTRALAPRPRTKPHQQTNAMLLFRIIGSFPEMMLRKETLPPFIHPTYINSHDNEQPDRLGSDPLVACRYLARLFSSRTKETSGFLWTMIKAESERLNFEVCKYK
jgi:hypothetical protein